MDSSFFLFRELYRFYYGRKKGVDGNGIIYNTIIDYGNFSRTDCCDCECDRSGRYRTIQRRDCMRVYINMVD